MIKLDNFSMRYKNVTERQFASCVFNRALSAGLAKRFQQKCTAAQKFDSGTFGHPETL